MSIGVEAGEFTGVFEVTGRLSLCRLVKISWDLTF